MMQAMPGLYLEQEMILPVFMVTAVAFVALSFLTILLLRSVPAKLIFLGVLMMTAGVVFGAVVPTVVALAWVMVAVGAILVLASLLCAVIAFILQSVQSAKVPPGA